MSYSSQPSISHHPQNTGFRDWTALVDLNRDAWLATAALSPEDVGGVTGFMEFLEAMLDPLHEEHEAMMQWYGKRFDPEDIDERHVRMCFEMAAARRRGPLMSHRRAGRRERT